MGSLYRIDRDIPLTSVIQDLTVEIGNKGNETRRLRPQMGMLAPIGKMIVTNASISGVDFREAKVVLEIIAPEAFPDKNSEMVG